MFCAETQDPRLPSLRATSRTFTAEPFVIDREGEMPDAAVRTTTSVEPSRQQTPVRQESETLPPRIPSSPSFEISGDVVQTSTLDPIKVTSKKKKGTGKKKRTQTDVHDDRWIQHT